MALTSSTKPGQPVTVAEQLKHLSYATKRWWSGRPGVIAYSWLNAGGDPQHVNEAVAVALAESGGNPGAQNTNSNGTVDRGLWQINSSHGADSTFDPQANARAAIRLSNNGKDWSAWCTSYDDGICHGSASNPHYKGAGLGNRTSGQPVLDAASRGFLYAADAIAGAFYGADSAAGVAIPVNDTLSAVVGDAANAAGNAADAVGGFFSGTIGKVLGYVGYGLLAAFGASLMLLALAMLTLALVGRQPSLAAIPGVGQLAGGADEAKDLLKDRAATNEVAGKRAVRKSRPGRRVAKGNDPAVTRGQKTAKPTTRVVDAGTNPPPRRASRPKQTRQPAKPAPF